ncbi:LysM peptidoglycan-binding domain-containing protein [Pseudogracilibacillus auburnensis]|uniref:LysM peptidoglycan-binding domain-containing protein n=1 Tax=Pseudogracilibacillus auburnensis TaxID=1494959 RepID=UPI001A95FDEB|nr:LysM peptidoglycan-binding domain-containing protein [Pseudogracilibacillus auburnensis]MBO1005587.1 LysM peptidoglycan-binding domain-containing protein [Pseudogracilibacillus auburnensis]
MPDRQHSSLTFPLEESLWFEKGQEVDELISISLDPRISIKDDNEYIILSGSLELNGEYKHISQYEQNDTFDGFPVPGKKYIQTVETRNENESGFIHHFPVEITIPKSRVPDISKIELGIQSFDYEIPEKGQLQVIADIYVIGLNEVVEEIMGVIEEEDIFQQEIERAEIESGAQEVALENDEDDIEFEFESEVNREDHSFELMEEDNVANAEAKRNEIELEEVVMESNRAGNEEEVEVELVNLNEEFPQNNFNFADKEIDDEEYDDFHSEIESSSGGNQFSDESLYDSFKAVARMIAKENKGKNKPDFDMQSPFPNLPEFSFDPFIQNLLDNNQMAHRNVVPQDYDESHSHMETSHHGESSSGHHESSSVESSSEVKVEKKKKKKDKYEAMSFADFFARKEDDAATSKLKMRLVQQGDSIQTLSEKYKVSPQQILRANQMEASNEVYEGQVLYIPTRQTSDKIK